jgi:hypothetical protein
MPSSRTLAAALVAALGLTLVAGVSAAVGLISREASVRAGSSSCSATPRPTSRSPTGIRSSSPTARRSGISRRRGRADARAIGRGVRQLALPVGKVYASAYCTLETARLRSGEPPYTGSSSYAGD